MAKVLDGTFIPPTECDKYAKKLNGHPMPTRSGGGGTTDSSGLLLRMAKGPRNNRVISIGNSVWPLHGWHINLAILMINVMMVDIPLCMGFTYDRWKKGVNIMIEKTTGDFNVKKCCIILLFEADFNANNKWIGCVVMYQAERETLLAEEQYGSRNKFLIHQCLNKQLFYNFVCFKWYPTALCSNDAKSCYNCITLLAAALCLCHFGGSLPMVSSMITTLHEMEHHIRTKFGDSALSAL